MNPRLNIMKKLLLVHSSANITGAYSRYLAQLFVKQWQINFPHTEVMIRDLAADALPHLNEYALEAIKTNKPIHELARESQSIREVSDKLVDELKSADIIVFGVPMYNYTIPSTLKTYIDYIVRSEITFGYDIVAKRPIGLLADKQVIVITTSGGFYQDTPFDFLAPYLSTVFSMIGLDEDLTFIKVQGLLKAEHEQSLLAAEQAIEKYIRDELAKNEINLKSLA